MMIVRDLAGTLDLRAVLELAVDACRVLDQTTDAARRRDVRPAGMAWDRGARELAFVDSPVDDDLAFAYGSPEHTGRVQHVVDRRSDLYSLGVVIYELLTGRLPFVADDPMAMIHSHIARAAIPPHRLVASIPTAVSAIVMRLLAKNADDRYQSAGGLAADLGRCLDALAAGAPIDEFALGDHDRRVRLRFADRLYGRDRECAALEDALVRARDRRIELVLVAGGSGVGKSALVREVRRRAIANGAIFIEGKFDQFNRDIPYSALRQALDGFVARLLTLDDGELAAWRERLLAAVDGNGRSMINLVPDLEHVLGPQPGHGPMDPAEARSRFNRTFARFIHAIAEGGNSLVIFLDDLQWVDASTLGLLDVLMSDPGRRGVLLVGAYRAGEVGAGHPFDTLVGELARAGAPVDTMRLEPLGVADLGRMLADALATSVDDIAPLAEAIARRSGGNPFFAGQLAERLFRDGLIEYDSTATRWRWNLAAIDAADITHDVIALMIDKLSSIQPATRHLLQIGACLGCTFDVVQLAALGDAGRDDAIATLAPAIDAGLVTVDRERGVYSFVHDRIQQAAYLLADEREAIHLRIARALARAGNHGDRVFEIASHYNQARRLLDSRESKLELVEVGVAAAERARASAAFEAQLGYITAAADVMPADADAALRDRVQLGLAEACYLTGRHDRVPPEIAAILARTADPLIRIAAHKLLVIHAMAEGRPRDAARIALGFLAELGVDIPIEPREIEIIKHFMKCRLRLATYTTRRIENLPEISDPIVLATMEFCMVSLPPVSYGAPAAFPIVLMKLLDMTLRHGHCFLSPVPFLGFGIILARVGSYAAARRFTDLGWRLQRRFGSKKVDVYMTSGWNLFLRWHWEPLRVLARDIDTSSYAAALEVGNLEFVAHELHNAIGLRFIAGDPVGELVERTAAAYGSMEQLKQWTTQDATRPLAELAAALSADNPGGELRGTYYDPDTVAPRVREQGNAMGTLCGALAIGFHDLLFGDGARAVAALREAERVAEAMPVTYFQPMAHLVQALALIRVAGVAPLDRDARAVVKRNLGLLRRFAALAPMNFGHMPLLVEAELASLRGRKTAAARYDAAASLALDNGAVHLAGLARELEARHHRRLGSAARADECLVLAHRHYRAWGATAKLRRLESDLPSLAPSPAAVSTASVAATGSSQLDLASLWKASRAVSGELVVRNLLRRMMDVIVENAGAHTGAVILQRDDGELRVDARLEHAGDGNPTIDVLQGVPLDDDRAAVPRSVIHYVIRTSDVVAFDDPAGTSFERDPYFAAGPPRSVLALAIRKQGRAIGVLYLENALTRGAFTAERIEFLTIVAAQVAISLENALLYENLENKVAERTEKLERMQAIAVANAHAAGMARIATDVLHNVGNILNSVTVSCDVMRRLIGESRIPRLVQATQMLDAHKDDLGAFFTRDPKGKALADYLVQLGRVLADDNRRSADEVTQLREKVDLICEVIAAQQSHASGASHLETGDLARVVDDALSIQSHDLARHQIRVVKQLAAIPPVAMQRGKLVHVLVNLIKNATEAMADVVPGGRVLEIDIAMAGDVPTVEVRDRGVGIDPADRDRIFNHGFTTKANGHGFGLHSCANSMTEMGGRIAAASDGRGTGATFTLSFAAIAQRSAA